jgi:hypothetical protein
VAVVALNRRFFEWGETEPPDPDFRRAMGLDDGGVAWEELLTKRRVVILAEAGSGKSTEMAERARLSAAFGRFAFHATVEDVGREGLEAALSSSSRASLTAWRASTEDAWFFIDSVDEAKSSGIRLEKVVRRLADGIKGAEERAHIVISGRITDWEFRKDLESLKDWLPITVRDSTRGKTPEEELLRIVRQEGQREKEPPSPEQPFVTLMAPLDRDRVRLFSEAKGVPNLDRFLEQIEAANLSHFARSPLDLDWLVRFWQSEGRLGSLLEMIERSVSERLKESNTGRARSDTLDSARALQAVERIGAVMVLSRRATIAIPDSEVLFTSDSPLDLADILPDWSAEDRTLLLSRPLFDPATLGRARLHNDNDGAVRGYLAARWLMRMRGENLSTAALFDLLFAKSYGLEVVKPSLSETVAWLALWDKDVASEVVRRSPSLLLGAGDPASLPPDVRQNALVGLVKELSTRDEVPLWWDNNKLRRFAQHDLGSVVVSLWPDYRTHSEAAQLLLRIAWLGALKDCASLAREAAFDVGLNDETRVFAGRALVATGDEQAKKDYAEFVLAGRSTLPRHMVRDAIESLFPTLIGVGDLLAILESVDIASEEGGFGFEWEGPRLCDKLDSASDLKQILGGLLTQLGGELGERAHYAPTKREQAYFPAIVTAALRLLKISPPEIVPELAVDAILRVANRRRHGSELQAKLNAAFAELHRTRSRRRFAFWRAAQNLRRPSRERQKIEQLSQAEMLGYSAGLRIEDVEWLLEDGPTKGEHDRRLAIDAALSIQRSADAPLGMLEKIAAVANADPTAMEVYDAWMRPQRPSVEQVEMEKELKEMQARHASESAQRDQSWIDFIRELRTDPARIARLKTPPNSGVNSELLELLRLLHGASGRSQYAIDSVVPLANIAGVEVAEAVRQGLIAHWRNSAPLLRSQREATDWNSVRWVDIMAVAGVSLEAASVERWADQLSTHQATLAAGYATLELNGFPRWLLALAASRPGEVRAVLFGEILNELLCPEPTRYETLSNVAYADDVIAALVAAALLDDLETRTQLPSSALSYVLQIIIRGIQPESTPRFVRFGIERFEQESDVAVAVRYLAAAFSLEAPVAASALTAKLASLSVGEQAKLIDCFLSASFGDSRSGAAFKPRDVPAETLEQLVHLTFQSNSHSAARKRPLGKAYQPNENDRADYARNAVFNQFVKTPGAATFQALVRLQNDPACPISAARLQAIAEDRALQDSESAPWVPSEALAFEQHHETAPRTPKELQSVLLRRLEDMQHDLLHGDFAQGLTLKALRGEVDVQNWVADRLRLKQGRSFSVERETHVADEKEPDVRVRAKATDANVAMEIKIVESWNLEQLEEALAVQLCGRYLRAKDGRYGVLLLVHQNARQRGWKDTSSGVFLSFPEVVARLSARAALIAGAHHDAPQPEVSVLDVSSYLAKA